MKQLVVCLGSGGIRGFAHIGVIQALEEHAIPIDAYCGTSVGSLVSVLAASGLSAQSIQQIALSLKPLDLLDLTFPYNGFIKGLKLKKLVQKLVPFQKIEELKVPVHILATRAKDGSECLFSSGSIAERVQASCAIPNIFRPAKVDGAEYLDGDLKSPVPMRSGRLLYPEAIVFGVSVVARIQDAPRNSRSWAKWVAKDSYRRSLIEHEQSFSDLFLDLDIGYFGGYQSSWARHQIQVGYQETIKIIPKLRQLLVSV